MQKTNTKKSRETVPLKVLTCENEYVMYPREMSIFRAFITIIKETRKIQGC